ncbi:MAG: Maf family protein [Candidatus Njordarchaeia archaeon]
MKLHLASSSPRRIEILGRFGIQFEIIKPMWEIRVRDGDPGEIAMFTALEKVRSVQGYVDEGVILGADTIVVLDGEILGKPKNRDEAFQQLKLLSGKEHGVITGVAVKQIPSNVEYYDFEETIVKFKELEDWEIECYLETGEPMDKAGSYGIQGFASFFVEWIKGDYYNVVGFPIIKVRGLLSKAGLDIYKVALNCDMKK